jgi:hypothetical protein
MRETNKFSSNERLSSWHGKNYNLFNKRTFTTMVESTSKHIMHNKESTEEWLTAQGIEFHVSSYT